MTKDGPKLPIALALLVAGLLAAACGPADQREESEPAPRAGSMERSARTHVAPPQQPALAEHEEEEGTEREGETVVVFLGDSLSAGFGLPKHEAFPAVVGRRLSNLGHSVRAVNAGVSGDTTAGGLRRLDWVLRAEPDIVIVELGANDMLRGQLPHAIESNLRAILEGVREADARPILVGMRAVPSLGLEYARDFDAIYPRLASELDVPLVPFLLEDVATDDALLQDDGVHPNAAGHARAAENVLPVLSRMLEEMG